MKWFDGVCVLVFVMAAVVWGVVQPLVIGEWGWWHGVWDGVLMWFMWMGVRNVWREFGGRGRARAWGK